MPLTFARRQLVAAVRQGLVPYKLGTNWRYDLIVESISCMCTPGLSIEGQRTTAGHP